jgi:hypothetical protein
MRMTHRPARAAFVTLTAIAILLVGSAVAVLAQQTDTTIDGKLSSLSGSTLMLTLPDGGLKKVTLLPTTLVLARQPATLDALKAGDALGVSARRESDGSLTANGINIFSPELWNVVRKGQWPMQTGDIMTNALVTDYALGVQGRTLRMMYKDVAATIKVPENVRIIRLLTERIADLKEGMHIYVRGTMSPEGSLAAGSVTFDLPAKA